MPEYSLTGGSLRWLWRWKLEIGEAVITGVGAWWCGHPWGLAIGTVLALIPWLTALAIGPSRRFLRRLAHGAHVRRRWRKAIHASRVRSIYESPPPALRVKAVPAGDVIDIEIPSGMTAD